MIADLADFVDFFFDGTRVFVEWCWLLAKAGLFSNPMDSITGSASCGWLVHNGVGCPIVPGS